MYINKIGSEIKFTADEGQSMLVLFSLLCKIRDYSAYASLPLSKGGLGREFEYFTPIAATATKKEIRHGPLFSFVQNS